MSIGGLLYKFILGPLELLFDAVYTVAYRVTVHPGLAIIFLSLAINLLVLPLYRRADAMQEEERLQSLKMKPGIDHIRKVFRGDERFMILQTYYRQNHYKPYYALKGSVSLLLEIPFFIAAYRYLSGLNLLQGVAFGPIADLGSPDGLIRLGGVTLNLLPILMTAINIVSGAVYTKGMPLKSKVQLYGMALVFLVLLYDSPSGLVFYWTLNNLFSLVKNVFYKLPNPKIVLDWMCSLAGIALFAYFCLVQPVTGMRRKVVITGTAILMQLPVLAEILKKRRLFGGRAGFPPVTETAVSRAVFYSCCVFLTVLLGLLIPSAVIADSPGEFVEMADFHTPLRYLVSSGLLAAGTFLLWCGIFYRLSSEKGRYWFGLAAVVFSTAAVIDYMFFGKGYGNLSPLLKYDLPVLNTPSQYLMNSFVLLGTAGLILLLWKRKPELVRAVCLAGCLAVTLMTVLNIRHAQPEIRKMAVLTSLPAEEEVQFPLSREGKNVVVIMLDRAFSGFVPYVLNEKPELQRQFSGFTYYPNTLSYGARTNVGSPPLYGGYDYIPDEINRRSDVLLKDKQNEALKIMPLNFLENGFEVTVCDTSFANYMWVPDLSIYDEYPGIRTYPVRALYSGLEKETIQMQYRLWNRNFFCYSLFRTAPLLLQDDLYQEGTYLSSQNYQVFDTPQVATSVSAGRGLDLDFMKNYAVLQHLPGMSAVEDGSKNTFMLMSNDLTHSPMLTQTPDYVPQNEVDNTEYDAAHLIRYSANGDMLRLEDLQSMSHYHAMMAAFLQLGNWFDTLREEAVWDNTRIILVADHGYYFGELFGRMLAPPAFYHDAADSLYLNLPAYNPLLMVKDFGSREFKTDFTFMTNADTPLQAFAGLIDGPVNPYLEKPITDAHKHDAEQHILFRDSLTIEDSNWETYTFDDVSEDKWPIRWLTLRNSDIFDAENWTVESR